MTSQISGLKFLFKHLQSGAGIRAQLARGTLRGLLVTMLGIGVGFLVQVSIARLLGVSEFGIYAWALAWTNFLVMVSCCGLEGLMVQRLPFYLMDNRSDKARGFLLFSGYWVGGCALICGLALYAVAWLSQERILPGSLNTLAICILVIPLFALGSIRQAALRALKHVAKGQVLDAVVRPVFLALIAVGLVYAFGIAATSTTAMIAQLCASAIVFVIGGLWVLKALPHDALRVPPDWEGKSWLKEALPFLAISGASAVSGQVGTLALGAFGTATDTGIYAAISRITDFALMGTYSVAAIASPLIVEVLKKNDKANLAQIMKWGARGSFGFAFIAVLGIVFFGEWILAAFGKGFVGGNGALQVMLSSALFGTFAGMAGYLLSMSGHAGIVAAIGWLSAACNLLICIVAVPRFGIYGAAFGYAMASLCGGLLCLFFCWRHHKVWAGLR
jgi:O-antigen/teichoic acid export membrane protein